MSMLAALGLAIALFAVGWVMLAIGILAGAQASVNNRQRAKWLWTVVNLIGVAFVVSGIVVAVIWGP